MDMTAVPTQWLTDIGDAIREKRDIATTIPVPDMPLQIGLIDSGRTRYLGDVVGRPSADSDYGEIEIPVPADGSYRACILLPETTSPTQEYPLSVYIATNVAAVSGSSKGAIVTVSRNSVSYSGVQLGNITANSTIIQSGKNATLINYSEGPVYKMYQII